MNLNRYFGKNCIAKEGCSLGPGEKGHSSEKSSHIKPATGTNWWLDNPRTSGTMPALSTREEQEKTEM